MKKWFGRYFDGTGVLKLPARIMVFVGIIVIFLAGSCFLYYHNPRENRWLVCIIYGLTGYYCPGCGAGRACYSILHGQFYAAFRYNPLLCILLPWFALYIGVCVIQWLVTGRETVSVKIPMWVAYIILAVVVLYGVLRNIDVYPFTLLAPTGLE